MLRGRNLLILQFARMSILARAAVSLYKIVYSVAHQPSSARMILTSASMKRIRSATSKTASFTLRVNDSNLWMVHLPLWLKFFMNLQSRGED